MKKRKIFPFLIYVAVLIALFAWTSGLFQGSGQSLSYSQVLQLFEAEQVKEFVVEDKTMNVRQDLSKNIEGRHVVILEDIFDTGNSLQFTYEHLLAKNPASLKICTLLDKPEGRRPGVTVTADYTGFAIPNEFVVGYGLDFNEHYRNLPYVGVLNPEAYHK